MRTIGGESRAFVLSANQCVRRKHLPEWVTGTKGSTAVSDEAAVNGASTANRLHGRNRSTLTVSEERHQLFLPATEEFPANDDKVVPKDASDEDFVSRGGSCIVGPLGQSLVDPLWEVEDGGLLITEADFEDCERGRLDLDVAGSYSRNDAFHLEVDGLNLDPPP